MMGPVLVSVYVFVLAGFLGFELINKVPPTLHTPLMSGANAMSGITIVGALTLATVAQPRVSVILGALAIALSTINVVAIVKLLVKDGAVHIDLEDEVVAGTLMTHEGKVVNERVASVLGTTGGAA